MRHYCADVELLRAGQLPPTRNIVVEEPNAAPESAEFDLVVCGGNIGILLSRQRWS